MSARRITLAVAAIVAVPLTAPAQGAVPKPVAGHTVVVEAQSGSVTITPKGGRATRLSGLKAVPVGTTVDATKGRVGLLATAGAGRTQAARLSGGAFVVTQSKGTVAIRLTGGGVTCAAKGTAAGPGKRKLRFEGKGRFRVVGCYAAAGVGGARASAAKLVIQPGPGGTVLVFSEGPNGTLVQVFQGSASLLNMITQIVQTINAGGTITAIPNPPAPGPTVPNPSPPAPAPTPTPGSCTGGITDPAGDAVQDTTGPVTPLPDILCASVVRDGGNLVATVKTDNPVPAANAPEFYFYTSQTPSQFAGQYTLFPCQGWLDMRQVASGFHGAGVYDCVSTQTVTATVARTDPGATTISYSFAAAPAGLAGPFSWRAVIEGTCNIIDAAPDRSGLGAQTSC